VRGGGRRGAQLVAVRSGALPELSFDEVDSSVELLGRRLRAPILISGMTGGAGRARDLNRALATAAQKSGLGMGVGSQRAMLLHPELTATYRVRDVAPDILLLANIGAVQARESGPDGVGSLVEAIGADALCVHLNVAQELVQDEGDRDFRGCLEAIAGLTEVLPVPVVVKETGCGFNPATLARLRAAGIGWVDVAGVGGTSWPGVEALRGSRRQRALGLELREWGIPTAAGAFRRRPPWCSLARRGCVPSPPAVCAAPRTWCAPSRWARKRRRWPCRSTPRVLGPELRAWATPGPDAPASGVEGAAGNALAGRHPAVESSEPASDRERSRRPALRRPDGRGPNVAGGRE
jgi:hypothetical protein